MLAAAGSAWAQPVVEAARAALPDQTRQAGVLKAATSYQWPPFASKGDSGDPDGIDIRLIKLLASQERDRRKVSGRLRRGAFTLGSAISLRVQSWNDSRKLRHTMNFGMITAEELEWMEPADLDSLAFGVIGFGVGGEVEVYSATESRMAGLAVDRVMGRHFFTAVAPCMNNFMVAQRFDDEPFLDATIDYVLTLRMRPTPVKLRLLKRPEMDRRFILVQRNAGAP